MDRIIRGVLVALLFANSVQFQAQSSFSATPELVIAEKPANFFVFYNYSELENLTDNSLNLRWVKLELSTSLPGGGLGDWEIAVTDPENTFLDNVPDSADFKLGPELTPTDKFIFQLFPNDQPGLLNARYKFYDVNNPADSVVVTFDYVVTDPTTAAHEKENNFEINVFPNPASQFCRIENQSGKEYQCELLNMVGEKIQSFGLKANEQKELDASFLASGLYFLKFEQGDFTTFQNLIIKK